MLTPHASIIRPEVATFSCAELRGIARRSRRMETTPSSSLTNFPFRSAMYLRSRSKYFWPSTSDGGTRTFFRALREGVAGVRLVVAGLAAGLGLEALLRSLHFSNFQ